MGSHLTLTSELGKGATFGFELQLALHTPLIEPTKSNPYVVFHHDEMNATTELSDLDKHPSDIAGKSILIAEDNALNVKVMSHLLTLNGASVAIAVNGHEAFLLAKKNKYDLVLMDLHMAEMDGKDATTAIRQLETNAAVPIVVVTANASLETIKDCMKAGADQVIFKPFTEETLIRTIASVLKEAKARGTAHVPPPQALD